MLEAINALVAPAVLERLTLALNHVISSEPIATARLKPHAGRTIQVALSDWPSILPAPPRMAFRITPAGLLEWCGQQALPDVADLQLDIDASNPALLAARVLAGDAPTIELRGDAGLAGDANWLIANLRWDVEADLERFVGPRVAHELARLGSALARGLRSAVQRGSDMAAKLRPGPERSGTT
jgi:ubiquinone biosynthesis protein UbiJ